MARPASRSSRHHSYYVPDMRLDEALLIKCYDSSTELAQFGPHGAFDDPNTGPDAPPRESIETGDYVFFAPIGLTADLRVEPNWLGRVGSDLRAFLPAKFFAG